MTRIILAGNVNDALPRGLALLRDHGIPVAPRGQQTLEYPAPVITHFSFPDEMVLFDPLRDANPFFHFFEALWILAGQEDVQFLSFFNARMAEFSDDGYTFHAPYGHRLRHAYGFDQIERCIEMLKRDPDTRQAVMSIWHPALDLGAKSKDIPCNDMVMLKLREGKLRMTVNIRSNDVIWGAYGANVVQFGTLLRYMAGRLGVDVGTLTQVSDSYHVYTDNPYWQRWVEQNGEKGGVLAPAHNKYASIAQLPANVVSGTWLSRADVYDGSFDADMAAFFARTKAHALTDLNLRQTAMYSTGSFVGTVIPMFTAIQAHKLGDAERALVAARTVEALDWRTAAVAWLERRMTKAAA